MNSPTAFVQSEYETINENTKKQNNFTSSKLSINTSKNRYIDILPIEETRVHLQGDNLSSDFINANSVCVGREFEFICTQAPLTKTFMEFWLMAWQQNCGVICALNRHIENRTIKGDCYWPEKGHKMKFPNHMSLKLLCTLRLKHLDTTIRRIQLTYQQSTREIYHLHYEGWPDFGVPEYSLPIRELIRISTYYQKLNTDLSGPIIVHCSAGIGRSGSFMSIASIMSDPAFKQLVKELQSTKHHNSMKLQRISQFNIPELVLSIRNQRNPGMVQNIHQYRFIYTALLDEINEPTTVSEALYRIIKWNSVKINKHHNLSKSGPVKKTCHTDKDYSGFLRENTSNDLACIFKRIRVNEHDAYVLSSSDTFLWRDDRAFLCKSGPLVMAL